MGATPNPAPVLAQLPYTPHGGPDSGLASGADGAADTLLDFSVNSNPFGPPPELMTLLRGLEVSRYPDPHALASRSTAAAYHGVAAEQIVLGGAAELIYRLAACYLRPPRRALVAAPSFGEYQRASLLHGAAVELCPVYERAHEPATEPLLEAITRTRPTLVWLCQPNNPTGHAWSAAALEDVAQACETVNALLIIDAAYLELSDVTPELPESAVQLFPLTKTFALAGLRAGYAVAPPDVAEVLRRAAPPWPVSTLAEAAVGWCRSPAGAAFVAQTVPELLALRRSLAAALRDRGHTVWSGRSSFLLLETADGRDLARRARAAGFRLRDATSFGLPDCVRIAAQDRAANEQLLRWLGS